MPARLTRTRTVAPNRLAAFLKNVFRKTRRTARPTLAVTHLEDRVTPATLHWTGATSTAWSLPANWVENAAPASGDRLVFDTTTPGFVSFAPNNDLAALTNISIGINDSSAGGDFTFGGNAFGLRTSAGVALDATVSVGTMATVNNDLTLGANTTASVGFGTLNLAGAIAGGFSLTSASAPPATLRLNAANTYTGGTVVTSGIVSVNTNTSLGAGQLNLAGGTLVPVQPFLHLPNSFVVTAPSTIGGGGFFDLDGGGVLNATLSLANTGFLGLNGSLSGPGGLREIGFPGGTTLGGTTPNFFTGGITVQFGGVTLQKSAGVQAAASPVTVVGSFASLTVNQTNQLQGTPVVVGPGGSFTVGNNFTDTVTSLTGSGGLNTGGGTGGLTVTGGTNMQFSGQVSGSGFLTYGGSGSLAISGASGSYTGTLTAVNGTLFVSGDFSGAPAVVTANGTLGGTGAVRSITATGGFFDPGAVPSTAGTINTASTAAASSLSGATVRYELGPSVSDTLVLGAGATIDLTGTSGVMLPLGGTFASSYTLVSSPTGGISGTFAGLPNASQFSVGGQTFEITYTANAVTLANLGVGARVLHWTGAAGSSWSTAGNWTEGTTPASGDTLVFDTSTPGFAATAPAFAPNNDIAGLTDLTVVINDASTAGDFVIGGSAFGLDTSGGTSITSTVSAGTTSRINNSITLGANTTFAAALGTLTMGGIIGGGFGLTVNGSPTSTIIFAAANTYSGGTTITSGTLQANVDNAIGTGLMTLNGGTISNPNAFVTLPNPFVVTAPSTYGGFGFMKLNGDGVLNATLRVSNGGFPEMNGVLSGPGGMVIDASTGHLALGGLTANTFTGPVTILTGELVLKKSTGVNAVVGPITVGVGSGGSLTLGAPNQIPDSQSVTIGSAGQFNTAGFSETVASLNGLGTLNTGSSVTNGLTVGGAGASLYTGTVSGSGIVRNAGTGTLTLGGASAGYTGQLVAAGGSLLASADFSAATGLTQAGGTLGGTGILKTVVNTGTGTVNPGGVGTGGILTTAPVVATTALAGQTFRVDLNDGGLSDQLVIGNTASIDLANATLSGNLISSSFGAVYTIIASPSSGITGNFNGLPDNTLFAIGGRQFRIDYTASTVTLTDLQSISLTPSTLPTGEVGIAYNQPITSTGGVGAVTLAVSGITNPTGLNITGSGTGTVTVSGTPTTAGTVTFTVTPSDTNGAQAATVYSFNVVAGVVLNPLTLPGGQVGVAYNQTITGSGGSGPIALNVSGVTNPTGLNITGTGTGTITISGTPGTAGTVTFTVTPTDNIGNGTGTVYSFNVSGAVTLTPPTLPAGEAGIAYNQTITSTGGVPPVTLAVSGVTNPTGLNITGSGTGTITVSGTPTAAGTVTFTVTPTTGTGVGTGTVYSFAVNPAVVLSPATLPGGEVGFAYSRTITGSGGSGAITLAVSAIANPTGLNITGSGTGTITVSGTPTTAGTVTFTVTPTDTIGTGPGKVYTFTVAPAVVLNPLTLPAGEVGVAYSRTITPTGGSGAVTLAVSGITNPTGLNITGSGTGTITLSGTPTTAGTVTFTVTPTDAVGTGTGTVYTFNVGAGVVLSPLALPAGEVGFAYNQSIVPTGGSGAVTLAVSGITNPTGLTIGGTGTGTVTVSGTPTAAGTVTFTVTPTDSIGTGQGTVYSFNVAPPVTLTSGPFPTGEVGFAYNQTITPTGGTGPVTLAVSNVTNPTGLNIIGSGTGTITVSGTPTTSGTVTFTVTPTDNFGAGTPTVFSFTVAPRVTLSPDGTSPLPPARLGVPYNQTITPTGGAGPVNLVVSNVTNAPWLAVTGLGNGAIALSGTPTTTGTVTFTVTPMDTAGTGTPSAYTFDVNPAVVLSPDTLPDGKVGTAYSQTITSSGGAGVVALNVSSVTNTTGLTIGGSGTGTVAVSGTPTSAGTVTFTVTPTDATGTGPGKVYTFTVAANGVRQFAVGADTGGSSVVTTFNPDATVARTVDAFPGTTGGVRVAVGDFNGDGTPDLVVGTGPGAVAEVKVLDGKTGAVLFDVRPFADFTGGVFVAAGDITGDSRADLVVTPDLSGGPRVTIFSGNGFGQVANFFGIDDQNFRGGARAGVGDVNGDGFEDLIISAGFGGGPRIAGFDGKALSQGNINQKLFGDFFIFEEALRNGAYVGVGDVNGDGFADLIGGGGPGGGPRVLVLSGSEKLAGRETPLANFFAGNIDNRGGVRVVSKDLDGDAFADVVVGDGTGAGSRVTGYLGKNFAGGAGGTPAFSFDDFPGFTGGVYVG